MNLYNRVIAVSKINFERMLAIYVFDISNLNHAGCDYYESLSKSSWDLNIKFSTALLWNIQLCVITEQDSILEMNSSYDMIIYKD